MKLALGFFASAPIVFCGLAWGETAPQFRLAWGEMAAGEFHYPRGVAVGAGGDVYITDTINNRVQRFDGAGNSMGLWGTYGESPGRLGYPEGLATDAMGNIDVVDTYRVQRFTANGSYITGWGSPGSGPGQFSAARDVAVGPTGDRYVVDLGNHRIQKFDAAGNFLLSWGSQGTANGQFFFPQAVAIGTGGDVYVADSGNHRIQVFSPTGVFIDKWGSQGFGNGQFDSPQGIAVGPTGDVFVSDTSNHRIQKFDALGTFIVMWGTVGNSPGQFLSPAGVEVDANGFVYVVDTANQRVQKFTSAGSFVLTWGTAAGAGRFQRAEDVAVGPSNPTSIYVTDLDLCRVQKFGADGTYLGQWGTPGSATGQFFAPAGIAASSAGNVYVVDAGNNRIQAFDPNGVFLYTWGTAGSGDGQFLSPYEIALDQTNNVYVTDRDNHRIQKFTASGTFLTKWGSPGTGNGQFQNPSDVAVDRDGFVWVLDENNRRLQKFNAQGVYVAQYPLPYAPGSLARGLAVDSAGRIYLSLYAFPTWGVAKLDRNGVLLAEWGTIGGAPGEFNNQRGLAIDAVGNVYVADISNHRIQKFGFEPEPRIGAIADVGNDQGRQVRVSFVRSSHDAAGTSTPISQYAVFRRIDSFAGTQPDLASKTATAREARRDAARLAGLTCDLSILDAGWDLVGIHPAFGQADYNLIVPTLADSTADDGIQWSTFFVRAATAAPSVFFDSVPDSGYSVDNLAPNVPQGFVVAANGADVLLQWEENLDTDLRYYSLYRSLDPNFTPAPSNRIATVVATQYIDVAAANDAWHYKLSAVDFAGNESAAAASSFIPTDAEPGHELPRTFAARLATTNPVQNRALLTFEAPRACAVVQRVYDVRGRLVRQSSRQLQQPGHHTLNWDLEADNGTKSASGVYFWNVETAGFSSTVRVTVVR